MKHSGIKASSITNPYIRAQLTGNAFPAEVRHTIKQSAKAPNKTEVAFEAYLRAAYPYAKVYPQGIGLRLANGCVYWPDFLLTDAAGENLWFYETKGRNRAAGTVKIKVAATLYPNWIFSLVTANDRSLRSWNFERVLP